MIVYLAPQHARQGTRVRERIASRLRAGQGVGGAPLAPKRNPDGRSLGGDLPAAISSTSVQADHRGFSLVFGERVDRFHEGAPPRQAPRQIVGLTGGDVDQLVREDAELAAAQITRALRGGS